MRVGSGDYQYEPLESWAKIPEYFRMDEPVDIGVDSRDRVYVGSRGNHPILIFDRQGNFVSCWGEGHFIDPHGIYFAPDGQVFITDREMNTVDKMTPGGELLMTIGTRNRSTPIIRRMPFNQPTDLALGLAGEIYVTDGYGNFLVHKFSPEGKLLKTWGEVGKGSGQFSLPHRVGVDSQGLVYVCDRNNDRIQRFNPEGEFVDVWTGFHWPQDLYIDRQNDIVYVVESSPSLPPRVSILNLKGKVLSSWGNEEGKHLLDFAHSICADSQGDIYVGAVAMAKRIQKFVKVKN